MKPVSIAGAKADLILDGWVRPQLSSWGFEQRRNGEFLKRGDRIVATLTTSVQLDRSHEQAIVMIHVGVGLSFLTDLLRRFPPFAHIPRNATPGIGGSVCSLPPHYEKPHWWIDASTVEEEVGADIAACLERRAKPFFTRFDSVERVMEGWEQRSPFYAVSNRYYLAAAHWARGDKAKAHAAAEAIVREDSTEQNCSQFPENFERSRAFLEFLRTLSE